MVVVVVVVVEVVEVVVVVPINNNGSTEKVIASFNGKLIRTASSEIHLLVMNKQLNFIYI